MIMCCVGQHARVEQARMLTLCLGSCQVWQSLICCSVPFSTTTHSAVVKKSRWMPSKRFAPSLDGPDQRACLQQLHH